MSTDVPLQGIAISDFRRLGGHRVLPLDAPIVLLHGPNGTGKTSVLSALELALTGEIRSMRRHDSRYTAHLPFHGQPFATVRATVDPTLGGPMSSGPVTVGGSRVEGPPALNAMAAQFYAERCYLDQVSLGQLLDLYQFKDGDEESALARFVNELLGLEQLDALRAGLDDANDYRRLKRISEPLAEVEDKLKAITSELARTSKQLDPAKASLNAARQALGEAMLRVGAPDSNGSESPDLADVSTALERVEGTGEVDRAQSLHTTLTALGGRIDGLSRLPSTSALGETRRALANAIKEREQWTADHGSTLAALTTDAEGLGLDIDRGAESVRAELSRLDLDRSRHAELQEQQSRVDEQISGKQGELAGADDEIVAAQEHAGSLVEGLAALQDHVVDNICPVCERDFSEVSATHLTAHISERLAELTAHGQRLQDLRQRRRALQAELGELERELQRVVRQVQALGDPSADAARHGALSDLLARLLPFEPTLRLREQAASRVRAAEKQLGELEAVAAEEANVRAELSSIAASIGAPEPDPSTTLRDVWRPLLARASADLDGAKERQAAVGIATRRLADVRSATARVAELTAALTEAARSKAVLDEQVREAKRRQRVARDVYDAASRARTTIVQRVFTESLNDVWRSVFTRLAPREPFVPIFGVPTASNPDLDVRLETIHRSGGVGGSPQMMLSAGNLNTAALSLFIALHLSVSPTVPCLVFDDPVQSMDEVHVAQFAGLIRVLAKHHHRQVIIAVHERSLFEYLRLELGPAFPDDELITIELGARAEDSDGGIKRIPWAPDPALPGGSKSSRAS